MLTKEFSKPVRIVVVTETQQQIWNETNSITLSSNWQAGRVRMAGFKAATD
jgi:hypothetical protein